MSNEVRVSSEEVIIEAPAQLVWDVVFDFASYHEWNAFCPSAEGVLELGTPLVMQVNLGQGPQEQTEYFTVIEPPHRVVWSMENKPGDPIHADRAQVITPLDDNRCSYVTYDDFAGDMVPAMMEAMAAPVEAGFNLCAQGLKARAEALHRERSGG